MLEKSPPTESVLSHPLFAGARSERVAHLVARLRPIRVEKGAILVSARPRQPATYLVLDGVLHPFILTADGHRLVLEVVRTGGYDGLLIASGHEGHLCEAASDSVVAPLRPEVLNQLIEAEPRIAVNLLNLTLNRLARREAHMVGMAHGEVVRRVAHQLLALGHYSGRAEGDWIELSPRPTHQLLSEMIGVRRETVSLQLLTLRRVGAVAVERQALRLHAPTLRRIVDHQYRGAANGRHRQPA